MKAALYLRTSTKEQHPEKQEKACLEFAKSRGYEIEGIYIEQASGYKDIKRPKYEEIKQKAHEGKISAVIVWAFDRWVRNKDTLLEDINILTKNNCKLHSVQEQWLEAVNIEGAMGELIKSFLVGMVGTIAQVESERRSQRTSMAYEAYKNDKRKYKKWGRKALPKRVINEVLELHKQGKSMRQIASTVKHYDKHSNAKLLSIGSVHKIIHNSDT